MATRFTANEARLKADSAKKALEEKRKQSEQLRRRLAKELAIVKDGFAKQRMEIIFAAIDKQTELQFNEVFLYRYYIDVGIEVVETGLVRRQRPKITKQIDEGKLKSFREQILNEFDDFIDASKQDLKHHYGGLSEFHQQYYDELCRALNSEWDWIEFSGDETYWDEVSDELKEKYEDYFKSINEKIKQYKKMRGDPDLDEDVETDEDEGDLVRGEYIFDEDDDEADILKPSIDGNNLKIRWTAEEGGEHMNDPLLSDVGLAWLTSYRGQVLIDSIFDALSDAAEMGKKNLKMDFSLSNDGWSFLKDRKRVPCCMPDELVDILQHEQFIIDDTTSTQTGYSIKVRW